MWYGVQTVGEPGDLDEWVNRVPDEKRAQMLDHRKRQLRAQAAVKPHAEHRGLSVTCGPRQPSPQILTGGATYSFRPTATLARRPIWSDG